MGVVIVGIAEAPMVEGRLKDENVLSVQARCAREAIDDAGLSFAEVDGLLTAGSWGIPGLGQMPILALAEYLGLAPRFFDGSNVGGSSFESHVGHAAMAIEAGLCDVALITYGSTQRSDRSRSLAGPPPALSAQYETLWGLLAPPGAYAMVAQRHMHEFGTTSEQLAEVAVAARQWAALNPAALMREPITVEDVLASRMVSDPLHQLECCLVTDGAGALVLTSSERTRDLRSRPVHVLGWGEAQTHQHISRMPDLTRSSAEQSGAAAMGMAGIRPSEVDVAEVYDSFTITVVLTLEALGFCARGEGGSFVSGGRIAPGGDFPLNTSGGGLSYCHPGMFGMFLLIEAVRQLRGDAGARQVPTAEIALVNGTGGVLSSNATCVLARG
jgi:acetyl-CoA acetyltransferase